MKHLQSMIGLVNVLHHQQSPQSGGFYADYRSVDRDHPQ